MGSQLRMESGGTGAEVMPAGSGPDEVGMGRGSKAKVCSVPGVGKVKCQPAPKDPASLPRHGAISFYVVSEKLAYGMFKTLERASKVKLALERTEGVASEIVERIQTAPRVCHLLR